MFCSARRVIERIARIPDNGAVALRIGIGAEAEEHFAGVVHVAIFVHHDDVFAEHHLPHAPEAVHHLEGLIGILLPDADEDQIVENTLRRKRHVHHFRKIHFEDGQENPHARVAHVKIFHRRDADDGGRINGVAAMRDRGQMKDRIILDRGVITGVIAERSFRPHLARLDIAFEDEIGIGRNFEVDRFAFHQLD